MYSILHIYIHIQNYSHIIYIYIHNHEYIFIYIYTYTHMDIYISIWLFLYEYIYIYIWICVYIYISMCIYICGTIVIIMTNHSYHQRTVGTRPLPTEVATALAVSRDTTWKVSRHRVLTTALQGDWRWWENKETTDWDM